MKRRNLGFLAAVVCLVSGALAAQEIDQYGKSHTLTGESGSMTVIDFAAAWCRPCWEVLPRLQKLAERHPEIRVVAVSVDSEKSGRDELVEGLGLTIPVVWDEHHRVAEFYRPEGMPATVIVDSTGDVVYRHVGSGQREWRAMLDFLGLTESE